MPGNTCSCYSMEVDDRVTGQGRVQGSAERGVRIVSFLIHILGLGLLPLLFGAARSCQLRIAYDGGQVTLRAAGYGEFIYIKRKIQHVKSFSPMRHNVGAIEKNFRVGSPRTPPQSAGVCRSRHIYS